MKRHFNKKRLAASTKSGFTIVEFTLATAFIAVLLITVAIITSNIISIYQKGLTLKAVNSVGRGLSDEFTESINIAPSVDTTNLCSSHVNQTDAVGNDLRAKCRGDKAYNYVFQQLMGRRTTNEGNYDDGDDTYDVQLGGVFCTGKYSYVWNTYYAEDLAGGGQRSYLSVKYNPESGGTAITMPAFRLIKIEDPTYRVCSAVTESTYEPCLNRSNTDLAINLNDPNHSCDIQKEQIKSADNSKDLDAFVIDITALENGRANYISTPEQGFLNGFDLDLQLYEFAIFPIAQDNVTLRTFMSGTFVLATERGNINLTRSGNYCDIQHRDASIEDSSNILDVGSEFNYCAINKFNFAARTAGM